MGISSISSLIISIMFGLGFRFVFFIHVSIIMSVAFSRKFPNELLRLTIVELIFTMIFSLSFWIGIAFKKPPAVIPMMFLTSFIANFLYLLWRTIRYYNGSWER